MTRTRVKGLRPLDRKLGQLPKAVGKGVLRRRLKAAGKPIAEAAKSHAPVLEGGLRQGIHVGTKLSRSQVSAARGTKRSTVEVHIGPKPSAKSIAQEFGTEHHPAHPYMRVAWDGQKWVALEVIKNGLGEDIDKAARRQAIRAAKAGG